MGTTPRNALRYPDPTDAPDGPTWNRYLAEDTEQWLHRAFPCTSDLRPTGVPTGFMIYEIDTGGWLGWNGIAWEPVGSPGATTTEAQYSSITVQTIPTSTNRVVNFGVENTPSALVTRTPKGTGHRFELAEGLWSISASVRYAGASADGERYAGLYTEALPSDPIVAFGGDASGPPITIPLTITRRFAAGTQLYVQTFQGTLSDRQLQPGPNGIWVRINLAKVG